MKRIILLVSALCFSLFASAQSTINITRQGAAGNHSVVDSTIIIHGSLPTSLFTTPLNIINIGIGTTTIEVERYLMDTINTSTTYLCWGLCFGSQYPVYWLAPSSEVIAAHDTDATFTSDLSPNANAGTEKIRYTFFNKVNPTDSASVIIEYIIAPQGINEVTADNLHISNPYPNPANSTVSFNCHLNGAQQVKLSIYNTIGQCMQTIPVSSSTDKLNVNVSTFPAGIYICKLEANGSQPVFQKLIVTH